MAGQIGVAIAPWRSKTNAIGPPSEVIYNNIPPSGSSLIRIDLPTAVSGQDGWVFAGTRWADQGGEIRIVRYVFTTPRGTFTATNGSPNLTAGVGTFWFRDLRIGDLVTIDGGSYQIGNITSETTATLLTNFTGVTGSGKTMTVTDAAANWYNSELLDVVDRDIRRPIRAAGVLSYGDRVFLWGIPDTLSASPTSATGNVIAAMRDDNPEHIGYLAIGTASGSDLVNVLATDGPLYLMTTTGLELLSFTNDPQKPYNLRIIAEPGFAAATNGALQADYFYGYNGKPFRTRAEENIDLEFAAPVEREMRSWNAARVMIAVDPKNNAVLYIHDDGDETTVIPWMAQLGVWNPPLTFSDRIIDTAVVNGTLYVTYLTGGNYRVQEWEGGAGVSGYFATQYYDQDALNRIRLKRLVATGKIDSLDVYAVTPDAAVPDVSNQGAATQSINLGNVDESGPETFTNLEGRAYAFRINLTSTGRFDKLVARGTPRTELR
jgi:hypothetical protein